MIAAMASKSASAQGRMTFTPKVGTLDSFTVFIGYAPSGLIAGASWMSSTRWPSGSSA
jgi:hypothetical protein